MGSPEVSRRGGTGWAPGRGGQLVRVLDCPPDRSVPDSYHADMFFLLGVGQLSVSATLMVVVLTCGRRVITPTGRPRDG